MRSTLVFYCVFFLFSANRLEAFLDYAANCAPRPTVLRIEHYPYFILLHRCNGSCGSHPSVRKCQKTTYTEIKVPVLDLSGSGGQKTIPMYNHTGCGCGCVTSPMDCHPVLERWEEDRCRCECEYANAPPKDLACKSGFKWDPTTCRCQCDTPPKICPPRKEWNSESCGCVCTQRVINRCVRKQKGLDHENCACVDVQALRRDQTSASANSKTLFTVIGFLLFLVAIMGFIIICNCIKARRSRPNTMTYPPEEEAPSPKTPPSPSDSGNLSCSNGTLAYDSTPSKTANAKYPTTSNGSLCVASRESTL